MSESSLRLAFDRQDGAPMPVIDLPADRGTVHLHLHLGPATDVAAPAAQPVSQPVPAPSSPWRGFWMVFGAIIALSCVYAVGVHIGERRSLRASGDDARAPAAFAADNQPALPTDPMAIARHELTQPPVVTPPPGAKPASAPNPFGLQQ